MKYEITAMRLKMALERKGMIAQELADTTGIHKSSISQYINGSHAPSNLSAGKMAEVLGVNPVWPMGFDAPMIKPLKHEGEMGRMAEYESIMLEEMTSYFLRLNDENKKKAVSYLEKLYDIQSAEEELR